MSSVTLAGIAGLALWLSASATQATAQDRRIGPIHIVKDCAAFFTKATCKIVDSNVAEIPTGSLIYYDQTTGGPPIGGGGMLDSNVVIYVETGDWAVGRCTLDWNTFLGVCDFSDGSGHLAGFTGRVDVAYDPGGDGYLFTWDGTYRFKSDR